MRETINNRVVVLDLIQHTRALKHLRYVCNLKRNLLCTRRGPVSKTALLTAFCCVAFVNGTFKYTRTKHLLSGRCLWWLMTLKATYTWKKEINKPLKDRIIYLFSNFLKHTKNKVVLILIIKKRKYSLNLTKYQNNICIICSIRHAANSTYCLVF